MASTITVKVDSDLVQKIRKKKSEWERIPVANIVEIVLRKFLNEGEKD